MAGVRVTVVTVAEGRFDSYFSQPGVGRVVLELKRESGNIFADVVNNVRRVAALRSTSKEFRPDVAVGMMAAAVVLLAPAERGSMSVPLDRSGCTRRPAAWLRVGCNAPMDLPSSRRGGGARWDIESAGRGSARPRAAWSSFPTQSLSIGQRGAALGPA